MVHELACVHVFVFADICFSFRRSNYVQVIHLNMSRNSSVGSASDSLSCVMQRHGFDPRERISGRGDFSLEVNMGSDSITPKLFWMRV